MTNVRKNNHNEMSSEELEKFTELTQKGHKIARTSIYDPFRRKENTVKSGGLNHKEGQDSAIQKAFNLLNSGHAPDLEFYMYRKIDIMIILYVAFAIGIICGYLIGS